MGTTTPWSQEFVPTASQVVALGQATPQRCVVPGTVWTAVPANAGTAPPNTATGTASADTRNIAARRNRQGRLLAWCRTRPPGWSPMLDAPPPIIVGTPHETYSAAQRRQPGLCPCATRASPERLAHSDGSQNHARPADLRPSPSDVARHPTRFGHRAARLRS